jgi:hypothetical protein
MIYHIFYIYNKQVLVGWDNIYECVCCYNRCHGNAVKGSWALWDNIYDVCAAITVAMVMLVRDFGPNRIIFMTVCVLLLPIFSSFLTGNLVFLLIVSEGDVSVKLFLRGL